jgi:hypothetical protein
MNGLVFGVQIFCGIEIAEMDIIALRILSDHLLVYNMCILGLGSGVSFSGSKNLDITGSVVSLAMVST